MEELDKAIDRMQATSHVMVVDRGHTLCTSKDPSVIHWVSSLPDRCKGLKFIILFCCHIPTRQVSEDVRASFQFQGKFHYTPPTTEWIHAYLRYSLVDSFRMFMNSEEARNELQPVSFELSEDDLSYLTECCDYATTDELYGFCNLVKSTLHRPRGSPPGTIQGAELVFNLAYCKHMLKNVGGCWRISEVNGYDAMQPFWESAGQGFPDAPQRSERTIADKQQYARNTGHAIPETIIADKTEVFTNLEEVKKEQQKEMDPHRGVPIVVNPYIEDEEEEEETPLKRIKVEQ